jgi:hypothetical protein
MSDYGAIVSRATFGYRIAARGERPYWVTNSGDGKYCFISFSGNDAVAVISYAKEREIARIPLATIRSACGWASCAAPTSLEGRPRSLADQGAQGPAHGAAPLSAAGAAVGAGPGRILVSRRTSGRWRTVRPAQAPRAEGREPLPAWDAA